MAMPKARLVIKVERDDSAADGRGVMVTVKEGQHGDYGEAYKVSLSLLTGSELMRVGAHLAANGYAFGDSRNMDQAQRLQRIESIVKRDDYTPREFEPKPRAEREKLQPPAPTPTPTPTPRVEPVATPIDALPDSGTEKQAERMSERDAIAEANNAKANEPAPTYAPGSLEAIIADIASRVSPKVDTAGIESKVLTLVEDRMRDLHPAPVRVTIVTPERETNLPELHHRRLSRLVEYIARGHHVYMAGPAGTGKSTMAEQAAITLGLDWHTQSCNPSMMESRFFGFIDGGGTYHPTQFRLAYEHGGVFCLDEIDKSHPGVLAGLNQALANGGCAFPDRFVMRHSSFRCIATANTWGLGATAEYVGSSPIDAATLNRFPRKMFIDYDPEMERNAAMQYATDETRTAISDWVDSCQAYRQNAIQHRIRILITPRDVVAGAIDLASGDTIQQVQEDGIFAGLATDIISKMTGR